MVPPWGSASTALKIELISASRRSPASLSEQRQRWFQLPLNLNGNALALRDVAPPRAGQIDDFLDDLVQAHPHQLLGVGSPAVKLPHAGDDVRDVLAGFVDGLEVLPAWAPARSVSMFSSSSE